MIGKNVSQNKITVLAVLSFLAISLITFFKSALELEDAEQAYYSQWLRWGYDDQPPLYTWLQYGFNSIFGVDKIAFSMLRGLLFAGTLLMLYRFSRIRIKDADASKLAVLVLVLIPVYIDFTFRRLSHTSLLCLCIVASYYFIQLLIARKSISNYLLLGLVVGVGMMSKYNYAFFLVTFGLVALWDKELRTIVFNPKILVSVFISVLLVAPHVNWLLGPDEFQTFLTQSVEEKIGIEEAESGFSLLPILIYLKSLFALMFPLLIIVGLGYFSKTVSFNKRKLNWFVKMFIVQLTVLGLFFLVFQSQKVETRWLLPLFIPFIVLLIEAIKFKKKVKLVTIGFWIFIAVIGVQTIRTPIEKLLNIPSSVHFGFEPIANTLSKNYDEYQWVLPNVTYAGNVRLLHPERTILSADDYSLNALELKHDKEISITINASAVKQSKPVDSLIGFGKEKENLYFYIN
ncbi:dolichyl-phosphate-mannose-protein mannosyltransferase [Maribacter spongiicola]|uniref:Dolichyl-phosphate-mannose-protein mannosyltransferase n=1 Tax=Maribacter spongiicola TaxID=1206753 RepID=A0A4R7JKH9_9FLAO|nr:glycosyltransferase family 39 protein [Maribacter spongiicola]TDT37956.1 dolichyl-phosphate-mannose-protein mannosyltransferase [Maribacter spongiicola]